MKPMHKCAEHEKKCVQCCEVMIEYDAHTKIPQWNVYAYEIADWRPKPEVGEVFAGRDDHAGSMESYLPHFYAVYDGGVDGEKEKAVHKAVACARKWLQKRLTALGTLNIKE